MKINNLMRRVICFIAALLIAVGCSLSVFAADIDGDGYDDETGEYMGIATQAPYQQITEAVTEYVEPVTEYIPPATEHVEPRTTEYVQPVTQAAPEETQEQRNTEQVRQTENVNSNKSEQTATTEFVAPTVSKTVSSKTYSTNYTAGVVSWACVVVGVLVIVIMILSTKLDKRHSSGNRA